MADWSGMLLRGVAFSWLILRASIGGIQTNSGEMVKGVRRCSTLPEYMLLTHAEGLVPFFECGWLCMFLLLLYHEALAFSLCPKDGVAVY